MQVVAAELLEQFEFSLPKDSPPIVRALGGGVMIPIVQGKEELGAAVPLCVSVAGA